MIEFAERGRLGEGPYLTGFSWLSTFDTLPSPPLKFVYHQLVRAARWLRQSTDSAATR